MMNSFTLTAMRCNVHSQSPLLCSGKARSRLIWAIFLAMKDDAEGRHCSACAVAYSRPISSKPSVPPTGRNHLVPFPKYPNKPGMLNYIFRWMTSGPQVRERREPANDAFAGRSSQAAALWLACSEALGLIILPFLDSSPNLPL